MVQEDPAITVTLSHPWFKEKLREYSEKHPGETPRTIVQDALRVFFARDAGEQADHEFEKRVAAAAALFDQLGEVSIQTIQRNKTAGGHGYADAAAVVDELVRRGIVAPQYVRQD